MLDEKKNVGRIKNGERIADKLSLGLHLWLDEKKVWFAFPPSLPLGYQQQIHLFLI